MSVFNCNVKYKKVEGDAYTSTYNKLVSQGLIDKFNNIIDVAKFYRANTELSSLASAKLGTDVRLYTTPMRPKGRVAVPDMKVFGMLNGKSVVSTPVEIEQDNALLEQNDNSWNDSPTVAISNIYSALGVEKQTPFREGQIDVVKEKIEEYNALNDRRELILTETNTKGEYLINIGYKDNYLYSPSDFVVKDDVKTYTPKSDNSDFTKNCII